MHGIKEGFFNAADYFVDRNIREGRGEKIAIYTEKRNYTYNDVEKMTNKTANALRELGLRIDDRIMLLMLDVPAFYAVFWGAIKMGAVPIPINTMMTPSDYEYYLNDSRAKTLFVSEQLLPVVNRIEGDLPYLRDVIVVSEESGVFTPSGKAIGGLQLLLKLYKQALMTWRSGFTVPVRQVLPKELFIPSTIWSCQQSLLAKVLNLTEDDICFSAARLFLPMVWETACSYRCR